MDTMLKCVDGNIETFGVDGLHTVMGTYEHALLRRNDILKMEFTLTEEEVGVLLHLTL